MQIVLKFRAQLPPVLVEELDNIVATIKAFFGREHHDDGTHGAITADSLNTTGDVLVGGNLTVKGTGGGGSIGPDLALPGNLSVGGTSTLTGAVTAQSTLVAAGNITAQADLIVNTGNLAAGDFHQSNTAFWVRGSHMPNQMEWGHSNPSGYGCTIGAELGSGSGFIAFQCEGDPANSNKYIGRGGWGTIIKSSPGNGGIEVHTLAAQTGNNLTPTPVFTIDRVGHTFCCATADSASVRVSKSPTGTNAVSGVAEGGISFSGAGIRNGGLWYTPRTPGQPIASMLQAGFGSANDPAIMQTMLGLYDRGTLANAQTQAIPNGLAWIGFVMITSIEDNAAALFLIRGGSGAVLEVLDPANLFSTVSGTASSFNFYYSAGYQLQNNRGATRTFTMHMFGPQN